MILSVITAGELYYGARDKRELQKIQRHHALIAATALELHAPLYTLNVRDFRFIPALEFYNP
jgi:predicted nucleic acid-binding protein